MYTSKICIIFNHTHVYNTHSTEVVEIVFKMFQELLRKGLGWRKLEYSEKTTDLPQATDNFNHIMLYREHLALSRRDSNSQL